MFRRSNVRPISANVGRVTWWPGRIIWPDGIFADDRYVFAFLANGTACPVSIVG